SSFLDIWHQAMYYLGWVSGGAAILIYLGYKVILAGKKELKSKYDFVSQNEVNAFKLAHIAVGIAIFAFLNFRAQTNVEIAVGWFFIRLFISICATTLYIYIMILILQYYYPKPLEKKLERLRYTPRTNPKTGNKLKLLSEEEEDVYLDEGMQAEEDVFSVDYDVWVDPKSDYVKIEKYKGHLAALECDRCGFQTLKLAKEEIIKQPSALADGEIKKEYNCTYCGRIKREVVRLNRQASPQLTEANPNLMIEDPLNQGTTIPVSVHVDILSNKGNKRSYEFQNTEEASKFLSAFDYKKLDEVQVD
ncbi:MAG: hypothetical protein AAFO69_16425, partial [Bacteroidota bacterium]